MSMCKFNKFLIYNDITCNKFKIGSCQKFLMNIDITCSKFLQYWFDYCLSHVASMENIYVCCAERLSQCT
jgi:hypothetical protein